MPVYRLKDDDEIAGEAAARGVNNFKNEAAGYAGGAGAANPPGAREGVIRAPGTAPWARDIDATRAARAEAERTRLLLNGWTVSAIAEAVADGEHAALASSASLVKKRSDVATPAGGRAGGSMAPPPFPGSSVYTEVGDTGLPTPVQTPSPPRPGFRGFRASDNRSQKTLAAYHRGLAASQPASLSTSSSTSASANLKRKHGLLGNDEEDDGRERTKHNYTYKLPNAADAEPLGAFGMMESGRAWFGSANGARRASVANPGAMVGGGLAGTGAGFRRVDGGGVGHGAGSGAGSGAGYQAGVGGGYQDSNTRRWAETVEEKFRVGGTARQ